jgi:hypothetical protein
MKRSLKDRILGSTGWRRRPYGDWADMEKRVAAMDAQDELIANLGRKIEDLGHRCDAVERWARSASADATAAQRRAETMATEAARLRGENTRLRSQIANATAISVPMYATEAPTQEQPIVPVMTLQAALGAA